MRGHLVGAILIGVMVGACSGRGDGPRVGAFEESDMRAVQVAERVAAHFSLHRNRPSFGRRIGAIRQIKEAKSGDGGVEVGLRFGDRTGDFKVYKCSSEANRKRVVAGYDRIERIQGRRQGQPYEWCYLARKDLLLDCQMIPADQQEAVKRRFLDAVGE